MITKTDLGKRNFTHGDALVSRSIIMQKQPMLCSWFLDERQKDIVSFILVRK